LGKLICFDSNILIYYLNQALPLPIKSWVDEQLYQNNAYISVITRIEILGYYQCTQLQYEIAESFIKHFQESALSEKVVQSCINLKRKYRIKLPDAMIAATALELNIPLATRNISDFNKISELQLINPFI